MGFPAWRGVPQWYLRCRTRVSLGQHRSQKSSRESHKRRRPKFQFTMCCSILNVYRSARIGARNPHENPAHVDVCENSAAVGVSAFASPAELARSRCGLEKSRNARENCLNPILKWPLPSGIRAAVGVSSFLSLSALARLRCGLARSHYGIRTAVGVSAFFSPSALARSLFGLAKSHCGIRAAVGVAAFFSPSDLARFRCGLARSHCGIRAAVGVSAFFSAAGPVAGGCLRESGCSLRCSQANRR